MAALTWSKNREVALALLRLYPEMDRLALTRPQLEKMVTGLPGFADAARAPSTSYLDHILWTWMHMADEDKEDDAA